MANRQFRVIEQGAVFGEVETNGNFKVRLSAVAKKTNGNTEETRVVGAIDTFQHHNRSNRSSTSVVIANKSARAPEDSNVGGERRRARYSVIFQHVSSTDSDNACGLAKSFNATQPLW
jgi:hypothetical protein